MNNLGSEAVGVKSWSWWTNKAVGHNQEAKKEINALFGASNAFDTPKPERLIQRILHIATNPGDLVLDSFLGSWTTATVAHKMGRRWIGVEMGEQVVTHCIPRLNKVIAGEQGGISKSVGWQGGGGYRFYRLGPPVFDEKGHIRRDIAFSVLAAHIYFSETGCLWSGREDSPFLGLNDGRAYALLYDGILGDTQPVGGNVLTHTTLKRIRDDIARAHPSFVVENTGLSADDLWRKITLDPADARPDSHRLQAETLRHKGHSVEECGSWIVKANSRHSTIQYHY